jgi:hypothetical protein
MGVVEGVVFTTEKEKLFELKPVSALSVWTPWPICVRSTVALAVFAIPESATVSVEPTRQVLVGEQDRVAVPTGAISSRWKVGPVPSLVATLTSLLTGGTPALVTVQVT